MLARSFPIFAVGLACAGCSKKPPPEEQGPRKPRVDIVVTPPAAPPASPQMLEQEGMRIALLGVPREGDLDALMKTAVHGAEADGSNASIVVSTRCLRDLEPVLEKNVRSFWTLAAVVGARCEGGAVKTNVGPTVLIESGGTPKVRITFDRRTHAFLKVEPLP